MSKACQGIVEIFQGIKHMGAFQLTEISIAIEINAEGGVNFIGTSKLGGKGAITLKFSEKNEDT